MQPLHVLATEVPKERRRSSEFLKDLPHTTAAERLSPTHNMRRRATYVPESGPSGSAQGALSNERPYCD
jgi:hypothetical protein